MVIKVLENKATKFARHVFDSLLIYLFQTFCNPTKCLKQLKLASTPYKMFENILFSFCYPNLLHLFLII